MQISSLHSFSLSALILLSVCLTVISFQRNSTWQGELEIWKDSADKGSDKARIYNNLGAAYFKRGMTDASIRAYEEGLRLEPDDVNVHVGIGMAYVSKGTYDKALRHYQRALELNPSNALKASIHYHLGLLFLETSIKNEGRARGEFEKALEYAPDFDWAQRMLDFLGH